MEKMDRIKTFLDLRWQRIAQEVNFGAPVVDLRVDWEGEEGKHEELTAWVDLLRPYGWPSTIGWSMFFYIEGEQIKCRCGYEKDGDPYSVRGDDAVEIQFVVNPLFYNENPDYGGFEVIIKRVISACGQLNFS